MSKPRMEPEAVVTYGELGLSREITARQTTNSLKTTRALLTRGFLMGILWEIPEAVATYGELGLSREITAKITGQKWAPQMKLPSCMHFTGHA